MLIAAEREAARTEARDVREALEELLSDGDRLTRRLLGVRGGEDIEDWMTDGDEDGRGGAQAVRGPGPDLYQGYPGMPPGRYEPPLR
ncbi:MULTISPECIES: hypothetical protein [unclassified Streptomyces]|uniref:hypothetical protein n=1 Tax=unclassified Streptomyces TaxID=2593676 RepID=UPI0036DFD555